MKRTCGICLRRYQLEQVIVSGGGGPIICQPCYERRWLGRRQAA